MKTSTSNPPPAVDDHFVREDARVEVVDGQLVMAPPAEEPHATAHFTLSYVLGAHVRDGYVGAVDMLTRTSVTSDFAPDASVFPAERDPETGGRRLEELAFEIAGAQSLEAVGAKARELVRRGVRRVFCVVVVRHRRVLEWSRATDAWSPLADAAVIEDRCFVRPLPIRALLDATAGEAAVVQALIAAGHPALAELEARGQAQGAAAALIAVLASRDLHPTASQRAAIEAADPATVMRWLGRAATVPSVGALLRE